MSDRKSFRMLENEDGSVIYFLSNGENHYHPPHPLRRFWNRIKKALSALSKAKEQ